MGAENPPRLRTNARIGAICGDVIENALPINALKNENPEALGTYAMVAILQSGTRQIAAMVTVEQHTDKVTKIDTIDLAHALNGRIAKKEGSLSSKWNQGYLENEAPNSATSMLSIADVIRIVNTTYQSILSDDVLKALGEERNQEGYYAKRVKFSLSQQTDEEYNLAVRSGDMEKAQEKSAEAAVYTDDGGLIPLSQRFKENNRDIRYSLTPTEKTQRAQERLQWEYSFLNF